MTSTAAPPGTSLNAATTRKLQITVLCGGPSAEREVSLDSGRAIAEALRARGHNVFVSDVGPSNLLGLDQPADVIFPALHGPFGEDGTLQRILEQRGIPFVGSGSRASAHAMDKAQTKQLAASLGIDTPAWQVVAAADLLSGPLLLEAPVVVKPVDQGSSVDTLIVKDEDELRPALEQVVARHERALVEQFIAGDELTVGIIGDRTLPPICIRPKRAFYDYQAKYQDDATEYLFDAGHPQALLDRAAADSRRIFDALGCRHLARADWMTDAAGRLWFLEINTLPGFTSHSLVPKAAARIGIPFDELVERLVFMALETAA